MVKNICQGAKPWIKSSLSESSKSGFPFSFRKVKLLPLVPTSASRIFLSKASELLCGREALHILLPFPG
jgi:hypothetical protein